jgi:GMP synthase (glutamine-hydrolysing)
MEKILILDFGSQYTQLIARAVREANVYCEIHPFHKPVTYDKNLKGIILSGSPFSVNDDNAPSVDVPQMVEQVPVLGICYGAQLTAKMYGGTVARSGHREFGRASLKLEKTDALLYGASPESQVWMSHGDAITELPEAFELLATTDSIPVAAFRLKSESQKDHKTLGFEEPEVGNFRVQDVKSLEVGKTESQEEGSKLHAPSPFTIHPLYGLQFHPEVYHSTEGKIILKNFLYRICGCQADWTPAHFVNETITSLKEKIGNRRVVMALSGGVDSTVAATLISRAIGANLFGIFVDNGVLRKNEFEQVLETYRQLGLNIKGIDAKEHFYTKLAGKTDPEAKRKAIGNAFIDIFDQEAHLLTNIDMLGQGTIYPDVIESVSVHGPSQTIKSHHNVGGLPDSMKLELVEPLRNLFKDEVRKAGLELGIPELLINRHPFPGPGLAIRILGEITEEKVQLLQEADAIYINGLREHGLYNEVWQAGAILLPVKSVGVMGDERTYEYTIALRAVTSVDGMTADWARLPYDFLAHISNEIINKVRGINRVVYDISSKPPATIEWE